MPVGWWLAGVGFMQQTQLSASQIQLLRPAGGTAVCVVLAGMGVSAGVGQPSQGCVGGSHHVGSLSVSPPRTTTCRWALYRQLVGWWL